jgi:hypothetical protein
LKTKKTADNDQSRIVAVVSDVHFDLHHEPTWRAFRKWHADVRPWKTVFDGDMVDFGMLSRYVQAPDAQVHAIPQIKVCVEEINPVAEETQAGAYFLPGNHSERWEKYVFGQAPHVLRDALGLSLEDQFRAHGLSEKVNWVKESNEFLGVRIGQFLIRHGHKQQGKFGGGKYLAGNRLMKNMARSEVFGHHHVGQMHCISGGGRTAIAIANPCMVSDQDYCVDPSWQRGFTILELDAPDYKRATPHLIIMEKGRFSWGGQTYDGNK